MSKLCRGVILLAVNAVITKISAIFLQPFDIGNMVQGNVPFTLILYASITVVFHALIMAYLLTGLWEMGRLSPDFLKARKYYSVHGSINVLSSGLLLCIYIFFVFTKLLGKALGAEMPDTSEQLQQTMESSIFGAALFGSLAMAIGLYMIYALFGFNLLNGIKAVGGRRKIGYRALNTAWLIQIISYVSLTIFSTASLLIFSENPLPEFVQTAIGYADIVARILFAVMFIRMSKKLEPLLAKLETETQ